MDLFDGHRATQEDAQDDLRELRKQFIIPTRGQLKRDRLEGATGSVKSSDVQLCTYLCGNSLGLQPRLVAQYTAAYHETWATKGVYGHFKEIEDSPLAPWLHVDEAVTEDMAALIGAERDEVAVMQTLTANLHLAMASFYKPTEERYKIIIESKAFPSDHFAVASQLQHHGYDPAKGMITIEPPSQTTPTLSTKHILSVVDAHASSTAVLLLPAIQFYTGQFFDVRTITAYAQSKGIVVGWDLAHAVGNVPLQMHEWNVDFAVWCSYKYLNCGPGAIGGLFIHSRHSSLPGIDTTQVQQEQQQPPSYTPRLAGWWGSLKQTRFGMDNAFHPIPGAPGWQLSNPSVADLTAMRASLDVFRLTSMPALRAKSLKLTAYLQSLLDGLREGKNGPSLASAFEIITPLDPQQRGAQLSLRLAPGLLEPVMETLEEQGVVVDERRPDVVRVAPAPLYNTFADCLRFALVFGEACRKAQEGLARGACGGIMVEGGSDSKGWSEVK